MSECHNQVHATQGTTITKPIQRVNTRQKEADGESPPGWSYNPASWSQRLPIAGLAMVGFLIAGYLALYQWGALATVWEPFFGDGSRTVLHSPVSRIFPVPDAALGAFGYLLDAAAGVVGGTRRWKTMPWVVIIFGLAVGPLGFISVLLVILQPVLFNAWCTLCLASATISVLMIGPATDEFLASLQHLTRVHRRGGSWWRGLEARVSEGVMPWLLSCD